MCVRTKSALLYAINICLVGILTSCINLTPATPTPDIGDGGFLSGDPCGPPCFWGIIPGQTTEADVMRILQEKGVYNSCETRDRRFEGGKKGIRCESFVIDFTDDVVQGLAFAPSLGITAQEAIAKYGEPEWAATYASGVHVFTFSVHIAYPRICAIVVFPSQEGLPYIIKPSTEAESISYDLNYCRSFYYETNPYWQKWNGYGEYRPYNW